MNVEESIKTWFQALEDQGEFVDIIVNVRDRGSEVVDEYTPSHGDVDGIGSINQILREKGIEDLIEPPMIPKRFIPGKGLQFLLFLKYLIRIPFWSAGWKFEKTNWSPGGKPERPSAHAATVLGLAESTIINDKAKERGVHSNTYLLWCLDQALKPHLKNGKRVWLIPVSLRSEHMGEYDHNITGFIDAYIKDSKGLVQLNKEIKKGLFSGDHFGGYFGIGLGQYIGKLGVRMIVAINHYMQVRTGVFTNLGKWGDPQGSIPSEWWGYPPVIRSQPVGALTGQYHGHITLALHFHPILTRDKNVAENVLSRWITLLKT